MSALQTNPAPTKTPWTPGSIGCAVFAGLLVTVVVAIVSFRIAWPYLYPTYVARYEMRLEVKSPQGVKTGSSIMEARYGWQPTLGGLVSSVSNDFSGEAVFVDLGEGKNLVVTLTTERPKRKKSTDPLYLPIRVFSLTPHDKIQTKADIETAKAKGRVDVPLNRLPLVISFSDITDPSSVQRIDPSNLEASFGPGYRITRATIEMTDKPLLATIEKRLPWIPGLQIEDLVSPGEKLEYGSIKSAVFTKLRTAGREQP